MPKNTKKGYFLQFWYIFLRCDMMFLSVKLGGGGCRRFGCSLKSKQARRKKLSFFKETSENKRLIRLNNYYLLKRSEKNYG